MNSLYAGLKARTTRTSGCTNSGTPLVTDRVQVFATNEPRPREVVTLLGSYARPSLLLFF